MTIIKKISHIVHTAATMEDMKFSRKPKITQPLMSSGMIHNNPDALYIPCEQEYTWNVKRNGYRSTLFKCSFEKNIVHLWKIEREHKDYTYHRMLDMALEDTMT